MQIMLYCNGMVAAGDRASRDSRTRLTSTDKPTTLTRHRGRPTSTVEFTTSLSRSQSRTENAAQDLENGGTNRRAGVEMQRRMQMIWSFIFQL